MPQNGDEGGRDRQHGASVSRWARVLPQGDRIRGTVPLIAFVSWPAQPNGIDDGEIELAGIGLRLPLSALYRTTRLARR